jgi:hypothetical protein
VARPRARRRRTVRPVAASVARAATSNGRRPIIIAGRRYANAYEWRWRTFPVFFTFAATLFATAGICTLLATHHLFALIALLTILAAIPLALALAHLITVRYIALHAPHPDEGEHEAG